MKNPPVRKPEDFFLKFFSFVNVKRDEVGYHVGGNRYQNRPSQQERTQHSILGYRPKIEVFAKPAEQKDH